MVGGIVAHNHIINEKPNKKFMLLNNMTGDFNFVDFVVPILIPSTALS